MQGGTRLCGTDLKALGIVDEKVVDKLISDYEAWFGRYEIAGNDSVIDALEKTGKAATDFTYGYCGTTAPWDIAGHTYSGGIPQMNTVFSWKAMVDAGIIVDVQEKTIN